VWCLCGVEVTLNRTRKPSTGLVWLVRSSVLFNAPYPWCRRIVLAQLCVLVCVWRCSIATVCVLICIERDFVVYVTIHKSWRV